MGSGVYTVRVMEQVEDDLYAMLYGTDIEVQLMSETIPFLYPNQYVWYDENTEAVLEAQTLSGSMTDQKKITDKFYRLLLTICAMIMRRLQRCRADICRMWMSRSRAGRASALTMPRCLPSCFRSKGIPTPDADR